MEEVGYVAQNNEINANECALHVATNTPKGKISRVYYKFLNQLPRYRRARTQMANLIIRK